MARPSEHTFGYEVLNSPPSIYGTEVSAEWKRTRKGEVIMTVRMPHDAVDSEVYIKTSRGHLGILMDPWTSSTWRKKWSNYHTPNKVTKDKLNRFNQERTNSASAYTRLLVDRNNSERAIGLTGPTEIRTPMHMA